MLKSLRLLVLNHKFHIVIWAFMLVYLLTAHDLHTQFFLQDVLGKPVQYEEQLPVESEKIRYRFGDLIYIDGAQYALTGWATYKNSDETGKFERYIVLQSEEETYFFLVTKPRKEFYVYIARDFIRPGTYRLGILFHHKHNKTSYFINTNRIISRTPNFLQIDDFNKKK